MATKKLSYSVTTEEDNSITIQPDDDKQAAYSFCEPLGKHLVAMEKYQKANEDASELETMAFLMSQLEVEGLAPEHFLGLPISLFKVIAKELNEFFRTD